MAVSTGNNYIKSSTSKQLFTISGGKVRFASAITVSCSISAIPAGSQPAGTSITFTAVPANGGASPSYQWKVNGSNVGTNSTTYTSSTLNNGDIITCVLTSSFSHTAGTPATSNSITQAIN
jgi:hypothetical protein